VRERPRVTPNLLRHVEQSAHAVAGLAGRVDPAALTAIVTAVDDYTIGFTLREHQAETVGSQFVRVYEEPHVRYLLESGEFPMLSAFVASGAPPVRRDFATGLEWLLDGFAAELPVR